MCTKLLRVPEQAQSEHGQLTINMMIPCQTWILEQLLCGNITCIIIIIIIIIYILFVLSFVLLSTCHADMLLRRRSGLYLRLNVWDS